MAVAADRRLGAVSGDAGKSPSAATPFPTLLDRYPRRYGRNHKALFSGTKLRPCDLVAVAKERFEWPTTRRRRTTATAAAWRPTKATKSAILPRRTASRFAKLGNLSRSMAMTARH